MKNRVLFLAVMICYSSFLQILAQAPPEILHYNFDGSGTIIPNMASSPPVGTANATIVGAQYLGSTGQCLGALVGDGSTTSYVNTAWTTSLSGSQVLLPHLLCGTFLVMHQQAAFVVLPMGSQVPITGC